MPDLSFTAQPNEVVAPVQISVAGATGEAWEFAVAVACHRLGISAFDQPVELAMSCDRAPSM